MNVLACVASWFSQHIFYFIFQSVLDQDLISEHIICDVYAVRRLAHAQYSLNSRSKYLLLGDD